MWEVRTCRPGWSCSRPSLGLPIVWWLFQVGPLLPSGLRLARIRTVLWRTFQGGSGGGEILVNGQAAGGLSSLPGAQSARCPPRLTRRMEVWVGPEAWPGRGLGLSQPPFAWQPPFLLLLGQKGACWSFRVHSQGPWEFHA